MTAGTDYVAHFLKYFRSPHEDAGKLMHVVLAWTKNSKLGSPFQYFLDRLLTIPMSTVVISILSCIT